VKETWTGTRWYIEGDVSQCFERIDHQVLLSILREKIRDNRFLRLVQTLLRAGYLENWRYHATLSGTPQGSIVSPVLSNLYLDKLDKYVEEELLPAYTRGDERRKNRTYFALMTKAYKRRKKGKPDEARALTNEAQRLPTADPYDPAYRRLHYVRYADLCRRRHKSAYAACRVMPTLCGDVPAELAGQRGAVGIIQGP
jgi:retron-type reverse transcriptase